MLVVFSEAALLAGSAALRLSRSDSTGSCNHGAGIHLKALTKAAPAEA